MKSIVLPYGKKEISYHFENAEVIDSNIDELQNDRCGKDIVREAMDHPIASECLYELAKGKNKAVILISDHTRPVPSRDIIPYMLGDLRRGNPQIDITLLVATGCHRGTTVDELRGKLGDEIVDNEKIIVHDAFDPDNNTKIGVLPSGAPLVINKIAAETDLLVAEGFIEPHFFAGFSGGRKSVLPGICDKATVWGNHCGEFIHDEHSRTGVLEGNPIHQDMISGAIQAKLAFIVNVVIDRNHKTVAAFAGNFDKAHIAGTEFLRKYCQVSPVKADIVVTTNGGAPLDQNLYQCVKGLTAAESCVNPSGTIILCAEMADGIGGDSFYSAMEQCSSPEELYDQYRKTPQSDTTQDQWQTQILCRVLMKYRVIFVTEKRMKAPITEMKMEYAESLEEALSMAGNGSITVIPDGVSVIMK